MRWTAKKQPGEVAETETLENVWDEDLREYNNPMPFWWLMLFYITIFFGLLYLALYPGLGNLAGVLGWSQETQYNDEVRLAEEKYGPVFQQYAGVPVEELSKIPQAVELGRSLYDNNCAACHGSDARGVPGFPNLTDDDWLYGGDGAAIYQSILNGRTGMMPPMGAALDDPTAENLAAYVRSLSGLSHDADQAIAGKSTYATLCVACHGVDGKGNQLLGAPNLTDDVWLHGSSSQRIIKNVREGVAGQMPAHSELLGEDKVRLLSAYVYSLSTP